MTETVRPASYGGKRVIRRVTFLWRIFDNTAFVRSRITCNGCGGPAQGPDPSESIGNDGLQILIGVDMERRTTRKERTAPRPDRRGPRFHRKFLWIEKENGIGTYPEGIARLPLSE